MYCERERERESGNVKEIGRYNYNTYSESVAICFCDYIIYRARERESVCVEMF